MLQPREAPGLGRASSSRRTDLNPQLLRQRGDISLLHNLPWKGRVEHPQWSKGKLAILRETKSFYIEKVKKPALPGKKKKKVIAAWFSFLVWIGVRHLLCFFLPTNFLSGLAANDSLAFTDEYHQNISLQLLFSILWFNHTKQPPHWPHESSIIKNTRQKQGQVSSLYVCRYCHSRSSEIRYSKYRLHTHSQSSRQRNSE